MKSIIFGLSLIASAFVSTEAANTGVDVSALVSTDSWSCAKGLGYSHAIVRCYFEAWGGNPGGALDNACAKNYANAVAGGFDQIDLYMFPCTGRSTCKSPADQVNEMVGHMNSNKMKIGTLWLDVEVDPQSNNWPSASEAQSTLKEFKSAFDATGLKWGVYASQSQWTTITGSKDWVLDSSVPLWYAHYDEALNFNDFSPFGGWSKPTIKQYAGSQSFCSANWDKNFYG
ncbi:glycoside hydrolase [Lichtheimia hyalospora FSU 10163]|nr:glycoside hydrolase [Lichtheimia hyalospora FSU 10163]